MTLQQNRKLNEIADQIRSKGTFDCPYAFGVIQRYWKDATIYNRKQNRLLKDNELDEVVRTFNIKDEESQQVICVSVKAKKNYTRIQWFMLLVAIEYQFYTIQQVKKHLEFTQSHIAVTNI